MNKALHIYAKLFVRNYNNRSTIRNINFWTYNTINSHYIMNNNRNYRVPFFRRLSEDRIRSSYVAYMLASNSNKEI